MYMRDKGWNKVYESPLLSSSGEGPRKVVLWAQNGRLGRGGIVYNGLLFFICFFLRA